MTLKELRELIDIVYSRESIEEFEIEKAGVRLRIKRSAPSRPEPPLNQLPLHFEPAPAVARFAAPAPSAVPVTAAAEVDDLLYVTAPILGTFYAAASPTAPPFVQPGDSIEKGSVVCIIEAMKLMNEIESDIAGEVIKVLIKNGQPVEFGEKLFAVRPR